MSVAQSRSPSTEKMRPVTASMCRPSMSSPLSRENVKGGPVVLGDHLGCDGLDGDVSEGHVDQLDYHDAVRRQHDPLPVADGPLNRDPRGPGQNHCVRFPSQRQEFTIPGDLVLTFEPELNRSSRAIISGGPAMRVEATGPTSSDVASMVNEPENRLTPTRPVTRSPSKRTARGASGSIGSPSISTTSQSPSEKVLRHRLQAYGSDVSVVSALDGDHLTWIQRAAT